MYPNIIHPVMGISIIVFLLGLSMTAVRKAKSQNEMPAFIVALIAGLVLGIALFINSL